MIRSVKELDVWTNAVELAMEIFHLTKTFPAEERYSMTDQIRRSSRSIAANLTEAWRKRRYQAAFVSKLSDAEGEAAETQTWVEFARRCRYLTDEAAADLDRRCDLVLSQLVHMIHNADKWCQGLGSR
jgi:four helix bundle protein